MRNLKLTISYDGTNYCGWQIQPNGTAIQELLQKAVRKMTGEENNVVGSGRTDAGVHAFAQVAAFKTEKKITPKRFMGGLNAILPRDIRVLDVEEVARDFHPIRDAKKKHYRYHFLCAHFEHPLFLNRAWVVHGDLDLMNMKKAASFLRGKHDFSAFRAADGADSNPLRTIFKIRIAKSDVYGLLHPKACLPDGQGFAMTKKGPSLRAKRSNLLYMLDIQGNGFLKNMVRNIAGTLVEVGLGKRTPAQFRQILISKDRKKAGVCAPACGLYLVGVEY